jgi:DDE superfamily endonuclease
MENNVDLLIMPPHCSHLLQPLDVRAFSAFKRAHSNKTDATSRLSTQRISRP